MEHLKKYTCKKCGGKETVKVNITENEDDSYENKSIMVPSDKGEYVRLEDVINLFSAKKIVK